MMTYAAEPAGEFHEGAAGFVVTFNGNVYDWCERGLAGLCGPNPVGPWHTPLWTFPTREAAEAAIRDEATA